MHADLRYLPDDDAVGLAATLGDALEQMLPIARLHGGIGFSDEADPHLALKRARLAVALAGGLDAMAARVAAIPPRL